MTTESEPGVDLYWLPLGAGGHSVRLNGRVFEAVAARLERRPPCDLYHSALVVRVPEGRFVIEQAPSPRQQRRGAWRCCRGAVGSRRAGRFRIFRYEVRRWRDGVIPDIGEAVASPQQLTGDPLLAQRVLDLVPAVPALVWGRDESQAGEMWNSNSLSSWLIARSGLHVESVHPPAGGRAPGWELGSWWRAASSRRPTRSGASPRRLKPAMVAIGIVVAALVLIGVGFFGFYRPWQLRWGARDEEVVASMPGDEVVLRPTFNATRAVTIGARPDEVWPWIVQIGFGRAGRTPTISSTTSVATARSASCRNSNTSRSAISFP